MLPSEGGHIDVPYVNDEVVEYVKFMQEALKIKYISLERSFCGPSLPIMYKFLAQKHPNIPGKELDLTS